MGKMKFLATTGVRTPNPSRIASPYTDYFIPAPEVSRVCVSLLFIIKNQKEKFYQWKCFSLLFFVKSVMWDFLLFILYPASRHLPGTYKSIIRA